MSALQIHMCVRIYTINTFTVHSHIHIQSIYINSLNRLESICSEWLGWSTALPGSLAAFCFFLDSLQLCLSESDSQPPRELIVYSWEGGDLMNLVGFRTS